MIYLFAVLLTSMLGTCQACFVLSGSWQNELGSNMTLKAANGVLRGSYKSAVGKVNGSYALFGSYETTCDSPTLAFIVQWTNSDPTSRPVSAWAGVFIDDVIYTAWLLTSPVNSSDDVWSATRVGTNTFVRQQ